MYARRAIKRPIIFTSQIPTQSPYSYSITLYQRIGCPRLSTSPGTLLRLSYSYISRSPLICADSMNPLSTRGLRDVANACRGFPSHPLRCNPPSTLSLLSFLCNASIDPCRSDPWLAIHRHGPLIYVRFTLYTPLEDLIEPDRQSSVYGVTLLQVYSYCHIHCSRDRWPLKSLVWPHLLCSLVRI